MTNPSTERLFGVELEPGDLDSDGGAPRWKQRALYDAMKDAYALHHDVRLARLSVYDDVEVGVTLGEVLDGRVPTDVKGLPGLLAARRS